MDYQYNKENNLWWKFEPETCRWRISEFEDDRVCHVWVTNALLYSLNEAFEYVNKDEDYYRGWKDNIAMAFKDEFRNKIGAGMDLDNNVHEIANNAADNFLKLLIG